MDNKNKTKDMISNMLKPVDINKVEEKFSNIGINIKNDDGTYRNLVDITLDVSKKFNEEVDNNAD